MKFINPKGYDPAFVRAVENDPYDRGESDFSATSLSTPPQAAVLIERYWEELEIDVSTRVDSIIGQGMHTIAERAARPNIDISEKRFFGDIVVDGVNYVISAQIDLFETDTGRLLDWKCTKAYAFSKKAGGGQKPEYTAQLNVGCELMRGHGYDPKSLHILAVLKNWDERDVADGACPENKQVTVNIPMWDRGKTVDFITSRIRSHVAAKKSLPACTYAETWGGRRCANWCDAKQVCEQYHKTINKEMSNAINREEYREV